MTRNLEIHFKVLTASNSTSTLNSAKNLASSYVLHKNISLLFRDCPFSSSYLGYNSVIEASFTDHEVDLLADWSDSSAFLGKSGRVPVLRKKAGC